MYKLMILIEPAANGSTLDEGWPEFLRQAERMPGLLREASVLVRRALAGRYEIAQVHELFFETAEALYQAMASPPGQEAGQILQRITAGQMTLLIAEHREDQIENIRKYRETPSHANSQ
jgi:hypothetical protein